MRHGSGTPTGKDAVERRECLLGRRARWRRRRVRVTECLSAAAAAFPKIQPFTISEPKSAPAPKPASASLGAKSRRLILQLSATVSSKKARERLADGFLCDAMSAWYVVRGETIKTIKTIKTTSRCDY